VKGTSREIAPARRRQAPPHPRHALERAADRLANERIFFHAQSCPERRDSGAAAATEQVGGEPPDVPGLVIQRDAEVEEHAGIAALTERPKRGLHDLHRRMRQTVDQCVETP
jgi:hypothetical protein